MGRVGAVSYTHLDVYKRQKEQSEKIVKLYNKVNKR